MRGKSIRSYRLLALVITVVVIIGFSMMLGISSKAESFHSTPDRYYTSLLLEEGQTLSELAVTYNDTSVMSNQEYIKEVKRINNLKTDIIHAGCYITILYF